MLWWLLACSGEGAEPVETEGTLRTLTYNVHGLPSEITGDDTPARMDQIAPLLPDFDLIGLQEDFDDDLHAAVTAELDHETRTWFTEVLPDRVYGSGLAVAARLALEEDYTEHYDDCYGVLDSASDCLASKGFQAVRLVLGGDVVFDLYNTHLEAGGGEEDEAARANQVEQLVASLQGRSAGHAVIFVGDFNLHEDDPPDAVLIERLLTGAGLQDACVAVGCLESRIDKFLYRSGDAVALTPLDWTNEPAFFDAEGVPLSDHDPLSVTFDWAAVVP